MLVKTPLYRVWKNAVAGGLKKRRLKILFKKTGLDRTEKKIRILEIGCANGKDALQFLGDGTKYELVGLDIKDGQVDMENFTFVQGDAASLPFPDKSFDLVISIGLLEHIEPMEKLSEVIREIRRVGKNHASIVPSVSTWLEPHTVKPLWPRRLHKGFVHKHSENQILHLNFFSDHTWTKFEGFSDAEVERFFYLFPLIRNTIIYKREKN